MTLPQVITPTLLSALRSTPHLPTGTWYLLASTALSTLNRPDQIPHVFQHAIENGSGPKDTKPSHDEQLTIARRTRESLAKSSAIIGLPKTINALFALKGVTPQQLQDAPLGKNPSGRAVDLYTTPPSVIMQRGLRFFEQVYGKVTNRVMGQMDRSGTEDLGLLARLEYGYVLSPSLILTPAETSFVVLASLIPQDVNPQLKGHLIGALNNGASEDEVKAVRDLVVKVCEATGMKKLDAQTLDGWGWREDVANLKPPKAKL